MNDQHDPSESGRLSPSNMFATLREQATDALELKTRSEAMAEKWMRDPSRKRFLIGLISCLLPIPDLSHPVFEKMLLGIRGRLTANDCDLLLCATRPLGADESLRIAAAQQTIEHGIDAVIAWAIASDDPECKPILDSGLPAILVDNDVLGGRAGSVMSANVDAMAEIVEHLYHNGRRRIAHISGHFNTRPGTDRLFGYRSELQRPGLPTPDEYVVEGDFFHDSGFAAAKRLLELEDPPDAIACASDSMAVGAMAAIEQAGLARSRRHCRYRLRRRLLRRDRDTGADDGAPGRTRHGHRGRRGGPAHAQKPGKLSTGRPDRDRADRARVERAGEAREELDRWRRSPTTAVASALGAFPCR